MEILIIGIASVVIGFLIPDIGVDDGIGCLIKPVLIFIGIILIIAYFVI